MQVPPLSKSGTKRLVPAELLDRPVTVFSFIVYYVKCPALRMKCGIPL